MPRILIVTARFYPFIGPRAHRWTSLAEYWAGQGVEVHVVCPRHRDYPPEAMVNSVHVHRAGFDSLKELGYYWSNSSTGRGRVGVAPKRPGRLGRLGIWLYERLWKNLYFPDDAMLWYWPARRKVLQLLDQQGFDMLISVSLPFTGHLIGLAAKRRFPALRWLADIGDPFFIQAKPLNNPWFYGRLSRQLEKKVLQAADKTVVTTEFTRKKYAAVFGNKAVDNMVVIPPLLHPPLKIPEQTAPTGDWINIGYFGAFYAPVRTPGALLSLLEQTFLERPDLRKKIKMHCYGEIFPEFLTELSRLPEVQLHGLRPRTEIQQAVQQMDILINVGNTTDFQLPSKAVEYLAAGKPVVNLSYVPDDPFVAFWGKNPLLLTISVENDRVDEKGMKDWIQLLDTPDRLGPQKSDPHRVDPFLIDAVANQYLSNQTM